MKKYLVFISIMALTLIPATSLADTTTGTGIGGVQNTLPVYELPELDSIEMPTLSKNYEDMADEMVDLGFGSYKFDDRLPLPSAEAPTGTGTNAYDIFVGTYGNLWNSPERQLNKTSSLPTKAVLNAASAFSLKVQNSFNTIKTQDSATMSNLLSQKLDTSSSWNLSAIKSSLPKMSSSQMNSFVGGVAKPSGWGSSAKGVSARQQFNTVSGLASSLGIDAGEMVERSKMTATEGVPTLALTNVLGVDNETAKEISNAGKTIFKTAASIVNNPGGLAQTVVNAATPKILDAAETLSVSKKSDQMLDAVNKDVQKNK